MLPLSVTLADSSSTAVNPANAMLAGGFVFSPTRQLGGRGNRQDSTQAPSTTQTQTPTNSQTNATPFADGNFGFGQGAALTGTGSSSLVLPAAILAFAIIFGAAFLRK